jgi:RHS repeat-associated protein
MESLGLSYNRARMLSTRHGRFWSMDEWEGIIQEPVSLNKFLYAEGMPSSGIDPSGLFTVTELNVTNGIITNLADLQVDMGFAFYDQLESGKGFESWAVGRSLPLVVGGVFKIGGKFFKYTGSGRFAADLSKLIPGGGAARLRNLSHFSNRAVDLYGNMAGQLPEGVQANHLFQQAVAKKMKIDPDKLLAVALEGSTNLKYGEHWRFHISMERFWDRYRTLGAFGLPGQLSWRRPTLREYAAAVEDSLNNATGNVFSSMLLTEAMLDNLRALKPGLKDTDRIPVPGRTTPKMKD